jgi:Flp pilus assembly protein TadG
MLKRFLKDERGVVAAIFAVALVPILSVLGLATDYSSSVKSRYKLQQVLDSTATALATDTDAALIGSAALLNRAQEYANTLSANLDVSPLVLDVALTTDEVTVKGSGEAKLHFGQFFGMGTRTVSAEVTVVRARMKNIELALVLDNTGSMNGQKINELKRAVKKLVDFLEPRAATPGDIKIAMVPFTNAVRVDPDWMPEWMFFSKPPKNWSGCVNDRSAPYDVSDDAPLAGVGTSLYWWMNNCGGLAEIIPLTSNLGSIRNAADTMIASGTTNVPLGIAWGWHALSNGVPLTQGSPGSDNTKMRIMIVLTDGENTEHRWAGNSNGIDDRMRQICANVKLSGITVYTIRVLNGDANLLRSCATTAAHYFNVTNADQLTPVFEQIGSSLTKMRISR